MNHDALNHIHPTPPKPSHNFNYSIHTIPIVTAGIVPNLEPLGERSLVPPSYRPIPLYINIYMISEIMKKHAYLLRYIFFCKCDAYLIRCWFFLTICVFEGMCFLYRSTMPM